MSKEKSKEKVEFVVTKTLGRVVKLVLFPYKRVGQAAVAQKAATKLVGKNVNGNDEKIVLFLLYVFNFLLYSNYEYSPL